MSRWCPRWSKCLSIVLVLALVVQLIPSVAGASVVSRVASSVHSLLTSASGDGLQLTDGPASSAGLARQRLPKPPSPPKPPQPAIPPEPSVSVEVLPDQPAELVSTTGQVRVSFPTGAVAEKVTATYTPVPSESTAGPVLFKVFRLEAMSASGATAVTSFGKELEISLSYTDKDIAGLDPRTLMLYYFDEVKADWVQLPSKVDASAHRVTASTDHFTVYGGGAIPAYSIPGTIMDFQADLHSGTATARYPIELPPGPGTFQPELTLTYNSGSVDEMKSKRDVGSWVGMGWTLHWSRVFYNEDEDKYFLEFNGASYELILGTDGIYRMQGQFWKMTKPNGTTFELWDTDGTYYRFGGTTDSVQYRVTDGNTVNYRYDLSLAEDVHGNQMTVTYSQDVWNGDVRSAYPLDIHYGVGSAVNVHFNSSFDITGDPTDGNLRDDNPRSTPANPAPEIMENKKLTSIEVKVSGSQVRKYEFAYNTTDSYYSADYGGIYYAGTHTLSSITQKGTGAESLPAMTFSYQNKYIRYYNSSGSVTASLSWPHLYQANSGFGATVSYTYAERPSAPAYSIWTREVVTQRQLNPGIGSTQITAYTYVGYPKIYLDPALPDYSNMAYRGFDQVEEADAAGNVTRHFFYTNGYYLVNNPLGWPEEKWAFDLPGREYQTHWLEKGLVVRTSFRDWTTVWDGTVDHPILHGVGEVQGDEVAWTYYWYDAYGNVVREQRYGDAEQSGDESTVFRVYYPNTTDWVVNRVARESIYSGELSTEPPDGIGLKQRTYYYYDGNNSDPTVPPTKGDLTRVAQCLSASILGPSFYYTYDSYGNRTSEQDPNGNTTSYTIDTTYYTYVARKTYPAVGGSPAMYEDYTWDYVLGRPLSVTDVNGQVTSYEYDTLGRRTKEIRPGDSSASATVKYTYVSWGTINSQHVKSEQKVAEGDYLWQKTYFDGAGRVVQVQARAEDNKSIVSSTTAYSNRGLVEKSYAPWMLASEQSQYQAPGSSQPYDSYEYDALGRAVSTEKADGTISGTDYMGPWEQAATDEKGARKSYSYDAFGQLAQVKEYDLPPTYLSQFGGPAELSGPQGISAVRGGLTFVADTGNHRVQKYSGGVLKGSVGSYGSGDEQFKSPYDVEVTGDGRYFYVADTTNNRVAQWSNEVYELLQFGSYGEASRQFNTPRGVALNSAGNVVFVADTYNNRVVRYNSAGTYYTKWGSSGEGDGQFNWPYDVAVDSSSYVYVVDNGNNRIQKFNVIGGFIAKWGEYGSGDGQFCYPEGIAFGNSYIYVVDTQNFRVQYFTTSGTYVGQWGSEGYGEGEFVWPTDVAVAPDGYVYVADWWGIQKFTSTGGFVARWLNDTPIDGEYWYPQHIAVDGSGKVYVTDYGNRALVFDSSGNFIEKWGRPGYDEGEFNRPLGIAYDRTNDKVWVADSNNHRVQKFEAATRFVRKWGSYGTGNGYFRSPKGIGVDDAGNVYMADTDNNRIQKFDSAGTYVTKWGTLGSGNGQFNKPWDVAVDYSGYVYAVDKDNNRVQKFTSTGTFITKWDVTNPTRLAIDGAGYVYVSSASANQVQKFTPEGGLLLTWGTGGTGNGEFNSPQGITLTGDSLSELQVVDSGNNRVQCFDGMGTSYSTTSYSYDVLGNLTQAVDNASNTTTISYNMLSRKTGMSDPDMGSWSYAYDDNGNLTSQTDARSQTLTFEYDALNRLTARKNGANTLASYTYDSTTGGNMGKGRRTGMTDAGGSATYVYDARGRTTKEDRVIDSVTYTTEYAYDPADRVSTITYPTNEVVTQAYNARGLPYSLSGSVAGTLVSAASYNQLGQTGQVDLGNGLRTVFNYHGLDTLDGGDPSSYYGKLYRIKAYKVSDSTERLHLKYWWDAAGNLTSRKDVMASETEGFSYDFLDRLTGASGPYTESYAYNAIGNMTSKNGVSYTYGTKPHAVTGVGSYTNTYDANGNMLTRQNATGSQALTWDVESHLSRVEGTGGGYSGTTTFVYDGDGNRIKKTEGGQTVVYVNRYYEKNTTTGEATSHYYLGGQEVAIKKGAVLEYLHQDHLSSNSLSTDTAGAQVSTLKFYPFGATRSSSGTLGTNKMFTSQRLDTGADLYFYNARYYDQGLGRFISADTVIPDFRNPQALNRYTYVLNNPLKYIDPTGHKWLDDVDEPTPVSPAPPAPPTPDPFTGAPDPTPPGVPDGGATQPSPIETVPGVPDVGAGAPGGHPVDDPGLPVTNAPDAGQEINLGVVRITHVSDQAELYLDAAAVLGDVVSFIPTPYTVVGGFVVSLVSSYAGMIRTGVKYGRGEATAEDLDISVATNFTGMLPWVGVIPALIQLNHDAKNQGVKVQWFWSSD
ncbi:MAG: RHS repeat-associated core domain-containing protein [Chloroflexota bacterium]